jgi:hypothetical protein
MLRYNIEQGGYALNDASRRDTNLQNNTKQGAYAFNVEND